jgi:diguanylate cyclase (GGDEF)-like protein
LALTAKMVTRMLRGRHVSNDRKTVPQVPGQPGSTANAPAPGLGASPAGIDLLSALSAAAETAYQWDFDSDQIVWANNVNQILEVEGQNNLNSGASFHQLIDSDFANQHFETIRSPSGSDDGNGIPYSIQYKFRPNGRRNSSVLWIEDHGRSFAGPLGKPAYARGIIRVINQRYQEEQRLRYLSRHDELTGHLNRIALTEEVGKALEDLKRERGTGAFIMVAVNNLSHVNEVYGFDIGDEMIQIVGQRLRAGLRDGDAIGRYSSNKFGLLLRQSGADQLEFITKRFHESIHDSVIESTAGSLATSICQGYVLLPEQAATVPEILSRSLEALERAKATPGNPIVIHKPDEKRKSRRQQNIEMADRIVRALNEHRMILALQPIVKAVSRQPVYYEALLRMRETDGTITPAGEFIEIAEQLGLVRLIDARVLELCVKLLTGAPKLRLSLNVSGETASDPEWLNALRAITKGDRQLTERMMVEITETSAIRDVEESISFVKSLKKLGCRMAIDDFGSGYSSFRNLRLLDFDMVKLDGSFIRDLPNSREDQILVRALIDLAKNFSMETVAEWVTDEATAKLVEDAGVTYMQGFYLGEPKLVDFEQRTPPVKKAS